MVAERTSKISRLIGDRFDNLIFQFDPKTPNFVADG